jgi:hypothetical protein
MTDLLVLWRDVQRSRSVLLLFWLSEMWSTFIIRNGSADATSVAVSPPLLLDHTEEVIE